MDTHGNARVSLADLQASAPRSFDKALIEILVAIQNGQRPIDTPIPAPVMVRDTELAQRIDALEQRFSDLQQALAVVNELAARIGMLEHFFGTVTADWEAIDRKRSAA